MWTSSRFENDAETRHDRDKNRIQKSMMRVFLESLNFIARLAALGNPNRG